MSSNQALGELLEGQIPHFKADLTKDVTWAFVVLTGYHPNKLTIVVVSHFLVEHLLDKIISCKCKKPNKIINYTFSIKVEILYSMGLLVDNNYKNIKKLNSIRNKIVHTLKVNLSERDMVFYKSSGEKATVKKSRSKDPEKFYLHVLANGILVSLRNHMLVKLKISPNFSMFS